MRRKEGAYAVCSQQVEPSGFRICPIGRIRLKALWLVTAGFRVVHCWLVLFRVRVGRRLQRFYVHALPLCAFSVKTATGQAYPAAIPSIRLARHTGFARVSGRFFFREENNVKIGSSRITCSFFITFVQTITQLARKGRKTGGEGMSQPAAGADGRGASRGFA